MNNSSLIEVLNKYNLVSESKLMSISEVAFEISNIRLRDITIIKSLHTFKQYDEFKDKCKNLNVCTKIFEQENSLHSKSEKYNQRVRRILNTLEDALNYGIPFSFFIDDKFHSKRIETLVAIRELCNNKTNKDIILKSCLWLDNTSFRLDCDEFDNLSTTSAIKTYKTFLNLIADSCRRKQKMKKYNPINPELREFMECLVIEYNNIDELFNPKTPIRLDTKSKTIEITLYPVT